MLTVRNDIRNIAIIAHVDHGKTTLVDGLLRQANTFRENQQVAERVMDSNDLERERGITILAKNTAVSIFDPQTKQQVKINIVDTPGHADFGGEVERVMNMVDGVLLLVDAAEGPMPQTRFVLKKALEMGHKAVVVINKVDRKDAEPERALNQTFDLFIDLGATDEQADFPVIYASATSARAGLTPQLGPDLQPLFSTILRYIPAPKVDLSAPYRMLVTNLGYDEYRGVTAMGRIYAGTIRVGQTLTRITLDGDLISETAQYLYVHKGLDRIEVEEASAGEIIALAGLEGIAIGETLTDPEHPDPLPPIRVEEPTVRMTFGVNTSPFAGREGKWGTSRKLRERLFTELRTNVALRVEEMDSKDSFLVSGRGELHLAILIETMRREGYEFQVSRPEVIFHKAKDGSLLEPFEEVYIETSADTVGPVVEMLGKRHGIMNDMRENVDGSVRIVYIVPTRGLLGFRYQFLTATRGLGVMNTLFHGYDAVSGTLATRYTGSLVAWESGVTSTYGLKNAEERGTLFCGAGLEVYEGMVIGEYSRPGDLTINVCKQKHLTNMRSSNKDIEIRLTPPREMSLDEAIEYLSDDELLEVTPQAYRIRKRILDSEERGKLVKKSKEALEEE
ncbi:MAG TPA: translational GTPase TypA [Anaerolineaceae bacterium]|nr:translational GTPase TypA [Anaerolineaceae bacterium]